ncbi:MAG: ABC-F family ATP-binding cassette domain-containing protein [Caldilineaceae bacterium]
MTILTAHNLSQTYVKHVIFSRISGKIEHGDKIGLVGPNGVGKTSLLRIMTGLERPTEGRVNRANNLRLGYLHQEAVQAFANRAHNVYDEMRTVFAHLHKLEDKMAQIEKRMAAGELSDPLFAEYSELQAAFERLGGYTYETSIEQTLQGLGFARDDWQMPINHLSGGQKTRALLARLLLEEPELLMLDEPTNHLDVQAIEWLETTLQRWQGALLIVSHDRYFLDAVVNIIWEMSPTAIENYRGNYSVYARQRVERWERRQKEFDQDKERLDKEMAFIRQHIAGRGHNMAMGKLRRISTELNAERRRENPALSARNTFRIGKAQSLINEKRRPNEEWQQMNMALATTQRSGSWVLQTHDLVVGYDEPLFIAEDIKLQRGHCAALIGPNGAGKTTFVRTLLDELAPINGSIEFGHNVRVGYFAQAHNTLNPAHTVLRAVLSQPLEAGQPTMGEASARNHLARYLFRADEVYKQVSVLSGGERGRLALALLALQGANLLLLDEPTNHLDLPAQEVLQTVLEEFDGTILLISHDRYLVAQLATEIWDLRNGYLNLFHGSYEEFMATSRKSN